MIGVTTFTSLISRTARLLLSEHVQYQEHGHGHVLLRLDPLDEVRIKLSQTIRHMHKKDPSHAYGGFCTLLHHEETLIGGCIDR